MALSALDPKTALIIIDLQKGIVSLPLLHPAAEVVNNARALADTFRSHGLEPAEQHPGLNSRN